MTITRTAARIALVGMAALSFAACSSDSAALKSDAKKLGNELRAAATKAEKAAETTPTTTTTAVAPPAAAPSPACPTATEAAAILGAGNNAFTAPICANGFAAGRASAQVDFGYLLQATGGSWVRASDSVQNEVCTTNSQGLPQAMVGASCID